MAVFVDSGYSTQARVSLIVASMINNGRIRFWFSQEFNPINNPHTSNPHHIFAQLDRAAKQGAQAAADDLHKAESVLLALRYWVHLWARNGLITDQQRAAAFFEIRSASEKGGLCPIVFHLSNVQHCVRHSAPDEFTVENEPLTGGCARQILPPQR